MLAQKRAHELLNCVSGQAYLGGWSKNPDLVDSNMFYLILIELQGPAALNWGPFILVLDLFASVD